MRTRDKHGRRIRDENQDPPQARTTPAASETSPSPSGTTPTASGTSPSRSRARSRIFVRRNIEPQPRRWGGSLALTAGLIALAAAALWVAWDREDPHYLSARKRVAAYEAGRAEEVRNYAGEVYRLALDELSRVSAGSASHEPARLLRARIERGIGAFHERRIARERDLELATKRRQERERAMLAARQRAVIKPATEYAECEDDDGHGDD